MWNGNEEEVVLNSNSDSDGRGQDLTLGVGAGKKGTVRRSNQLIIKVINPQYSLGALMLKLKLQYFVQ